MFAHTSAVNQKAKSEASEKQPGPLTSVIGETGR